MTARVGAVILAAGRSRRFDLDGRGTKAAALINGVPLVRAVALTALSSSAATVTVITGHEHERVEAALGGLPVHIVHNAGFMTGLASSLKLGLNTIEKYLDGALVMLADMPRVKASTLDRLVGYFEQPAETHAVVPVFGGERGNPVLIGRRLFPATQNLRGDEGARRLLSDTSLVVSLCKVDDPGVLININTLAELRAVAHEG